MNRRFRAFFVGLAGVAFFVGISSADVLHLKTGGRLDGVLVKETAANLTIDVGMGQLSVPRSSVLRIERTESGLSEYRARLASIQPGDVGACADLARYASENGLRNESRLMWARVLSLNPGNVEAHLALGHVLVGGHYVDQAEANRAQGLVHFEGRWMTPAEQAFVLREREQRLDEERRTREARRAAWEEEDRERRSAARAERERAAAENAAGLPVWGYGGVPWVGYGGIYGGGYGGIYGGGYGGGHGGCVGASCYVSPPIWTPRPPLPVATPIPRARPVQPRSWR